MKKSLATRVAEFWDWVDARDIDAQLVAITILYVSYEITAWAMKFGETAERPGAEVAMIIGAILGPWAIVQGAAVKFILEHRRAP